MKFKNYTFTALLVTHGLSFATIAQKDTLTEIFPGVNYRIYVGSDQVGFVTGNNSFGDKAKLQKFDESYGVSSTGVIDGLAMAIPVKIDGGGSFDIAIWEDVNGTPGNTLATKTVNLADIDTSKNNFKLIKGGWYSNLNVNFDFPVSIPSNRKFWAGVYLPQTNTDFIAIYTSEVGSFPDANRDVGEVWKDDDFHFFSGESNSWNSDVALAIFPIVTFTQLNTLNQEVTSDLQVFPNPSHDYVELNSGASLCRVEIFDITGQRVREIEIGDGLIKSKRISVSDLSIGRYIKRVEDEHGNVRNAHFEKL